MQNASKLWASVESKVHEAAAVGAERHKQRVIENLEIDTAQGRFESPIEVLFAAWWEALKGSHGMEWAWLESQYKVEIDGERFRIDFTVYMDTHPGTYGSDVFNAYPLIAIELDGHEFHERTKEQVTYRNKRDRALQGAGWSVYHVSGSELHRNAEACVAELLERVRKAWAPFWSKYWTEVNLLRAERT